MTRLCEMGLKRLLIGDDDGHLSEYDPGEEMVVVVPIQFGVLLHNTRS